MGFRQEGHGSNPWAWAPTTHPAVAVHCAFRRDPRPDTPYPSFPMAILVFEHVPAEPTYRLGQTLLAQNHELRIVRHYAGDRVPVDLDGVDGVISMGGPMNVDEADQHEWMPKEMDYLKTAHAVGIPIVGVCLGCQLLAAALGGKVGPMNAKEIGWFPIKQSFPGTIDPLYAGIPWDTVQFHVHGQEVTQLPPGATPLAGSKACKVQAFKVGLTTYGFQYHFEVDKGAIESWCRTDEWIRQHADADAILAAVDQHYPSYRRLGDRLCNQIATLLMPIDKPASKRLVTAP